MHIGATNDNFIFFIKVGHEIVQGPDWKNLLSRFTSGTFSIGPKSRDPMRASSATAGVLFPKLSHDIITQGQNTPSCVITEIAQSR